VAVPASGGAQEVGHETAGAMVTCGAGLVYENPSTPAAYSQGQQKYGLS
jgi:hypothetical protein